MKSLADHVREYGAYHQDPWNKLTHFVGVPLVTFSILLFLGWLRFAHYPEIPFTGGTLFYLVVFLYFLSLDWQITLLQAPFTLTLLWLADVVARWPFAESLIMFLATFIGGWIVQLIGHVFEGKRPALADNILQLFNAPVFLTTEVVVLLGYREDLRRAFDAEASTPRHPREAPAADEALA
jgi:uncharacterized membrane protein YGL010W